MNRKTMIEIEPDALWTPAQVMRVLCISATTLRRLATEGDLPAVRVGKQRRFKRAVVLAYIGEGEASHAAA